MREGIPRQRVGRDGSCRREEKANNTLQTGLREALGGEIEGPVWMASGDHGWESGLEGSFGGNSGIGAVATWL